MIKTPIIPSICYLCSCLLLSITSSIFAQNDLTFNELSTKNGLEDTKIVFVHKDSRGFSWIGTLGSLYRFDGSEVLTYGPEKGVDEPYLQSSMFEDKRGNLWFCTYNKLFCYERLRDTCLSFGGFREKNGAETIADYGLIHLDKQDQLWVTAGGNIFRLNLSQTLKQKKLSFLTYSTGEAKVEGKRFYPLLNQEEELSGFFEYFLIGPGMKVWTKSNQHRAFTNKDFFSAENPQSTLLKINQVLPLARQYNQYFLLTTEGIVMFNRGNEQFSTFFKPPIGLRLFFAIYVQPEILLCSTTEGLHYLNIKTRQWSKALDWSAKLNTNDISRKNIRDLYLDRDNILWGMAFDEGLCFTNPDLFQASFTELGFKVEHWLEISKDEWLLGTLNGLLFMEKGEKKKHFLTARITGIYKDLQKNIWVLSDAGLYLFNAQNQRLTKVLGESYLFGFYQSSDGTYWLGSNRDTKKWDPVQNQKKDINAYTAMMIGSRSFWEDPLYKRLYAHENGSNLHIMQYHDGNWEIDTVFSIKGFLGGYLLPKGSDKVWVGTVNGIKLIHRTKAIIEDLPFPPTWPNTNITGMVQDQRGTIWISTNTNILSFDAKGKPLRLYTTREGFLAGPFQNESMQVLADQSIVIIGKYGLNRFEPANLNQKNPLPKIQITRLSVQGAPYHQLFPQDSSIFEKKRIRLKYRQNSISLRLVGIELGQPNQVKIQYYLKNWEKAEEASIRNQFAEARYGKLNPGSYTLMVRAANANGEWTPWNAKLQIEVIPPYWMRWWFKMIIGLIGALAVAAGVQWYYRAQLREARIRNEEQERILRDIHDLTSGKVVFFQDFQSFAEQEIPGTDAKAKALGIADQALQLFKRISAAVRNSAESDSTLLEFLQQLIAESKKNVGNKLDFSTKLNSSIPYAWVAGENKKQLRLVVQEAIGNTLKHAQATSLLLSIKVEDGKLKMVLQDNGKGISESQIAQIKPTEKIQDSGNGLGNMLARVKQIGAEIKWSNDQGTQVLISISLHKIRPRRKIFFNFARFFLL